MNRDSQPNLRHHRDERQSMSNQKSRLGDTVPFWEKGMIARLLPSPGPATALATAGLAFLLYLSTLAPGLTWANHGADGGDLLAAAASNGVPHPTGYPLYTMLLQTWLALWGWIVPRSDIAWRGNLFSGFWAAVSVGITAHLVYRRLAGKRSAAWLWAAGAGLAWGSSPLLWSQAVITEVYALHAALIALLGWVLWVYSPRAAWRRALALGLVVGLGLAHHVTIVLLLPAVAYWLWSEPNRPASQTRHPGRFWLLATAGVALGLLFYLRLPVVAAGSQPPPVDWGYPQHWPGVWWLVSGAAYRRYLFAVEPSQLLAHISAWALAVSTQYTPLGFGLALVGLYHQDQHEPRLRNFGLLWVLPISIYTVGYNTLDSEIYLLPVAWMMALWLVDGLPTIADMAASYLSLPAERARRWTLGVAVLALLLLTGIRFPVYSLRQDRQAEQFVTGAAAVLEPGSLVFSSADAETFALWYGAWGSGELLAAAPGTAFINVALYQFDWYRRLMADLYPELEGVDQSPHVLLDANAGRRPIFFSEILPLVSENDLEPAGPLWRYRAEPAAP